MHAVDDQRNDEHPALEPAANGRPERALVPTRVLPAQLTGTTPDRAQALRATVELEGHGVVPTRPRRSSALPLGSRLGHYILDRKLGAGGMGEVFAATDIRTGDRVALKSLSLVTATRLYRFKREFRALAGVSHHNLIRLQHLVVPDDGPAFFTMELVDGVPFVDWVRGSTPPGAPPDLDRLERGLLQLVEGVHHLHTHDCIHRDLKPPNVLVTADGRVVILDFGLVSELSDPAKGITCDRQILGTPSYMAPEQARGERAEVASDYYAIGVMLFECLTGRLPHDGTPMAQMYAKQNLSVDFGDSVDSMPPWLHSLCARLLARAPDARPRAHHVMKVLRAPSVRPHRPTSVFVGRRDELHTLHTALDQVLEHDEAVVVHVRGNSGDGKSALLRRFCSDLADRGTVVLRGRCHEHETVPYKGVDAIVDALSAYLRRLPQPQLMQACPPDLDALVRVFPVLGEIWRQPAPQPPGQCDVRKRGGTALRKLLRHLSAEHPLVVHIDDFQWADRDSVDLLEDLARPTDPPSMLLLLSYRRETEDSEALTALRDNPTLAGPDARLLDLGPLPPSDARRLARSLLSVDERTLASVRAETIALRSQGSPLFITQIALGSQLEDDSDVDELIIHRLAQLAPEARRLVRVVAIYGGPVSAELALTLGRASAETLDSLCALGLLVRDEAEGGTDRIETAHDRVREAAIASLDAECKARLHRRIGERLLRRCDGEPSEEDIFPIVDHLVAGLDGSVVLSSNRRLGLARLANLAGQRALESAAWVAARHYFSCAQQMLEPWLPGARRGRGQYRLCVDVAFGLVQIDITLEQPQGSRALHDLLAWSLSTTDYCRIAQWYCEVLFLQVRFAEGVEFGVRSLAHVGLPIRASKLRSLLSFRHRWRSLFRRGLGQLSSPPREADPHTRACMDILAVICAPAMAVDSEVKLDILAHYVRLLTTHGLHEQAGLGLSALALAAVTLGQHRRARQIIEFIETGAEAHQLSTLCYFMTKTCSLTVSSTVNPLDDIMHAYDRLYVRAREAAPGALVQLAGTGHLFTAHIGGLPLPQLGQILRRLTNDSGPTPFTSTTELVAELWRHIEALTEGPAKLELAQEPGQNLTYIIRSWTLLSRMLAAFLLGDHEAAESVAQQLPRAYHRSWGPFWLVPMCAMMSTLISAERWHDADAQQRRWIRRALRKHRSNAAPWARACPQNYRPMLDIIDGEIAALDGRYLDAVAAYEHATAFAADGGMHWLMGLASERLGALARRHGHLTTANGALDVAERAYETWGATAVMRRLQRARATDRARLGEPAQSSMVQ